MSNQTYDELLREVMIDLREQIDFEQPPSKDILPKDKIEQKKFFKQYYCGLYVRYLMILNKLEDCYDQILQPQKREDVKRVLESTIIRFLNVRSILIQLGGEYVDLDDVLVDLKQTPEVLEINVPRYFKEDDEKEIKRRDILMNILLERHGIDDQSLALDMMEDNLVPMTIQEAVLIIQTNERGRQGRQSTKYKRDLKKREERVRKVVEHGEFQMDRSKAAALVQKIYKGYITRKKTRQMIKEELEFLGMAESDSVEKLSALDRISKTRARRKLIQAQNKSELQHQRKETRERIIRDEGPRIEEDMHDAIIEKIILYRESAAPGEGGLPSFPSEEDGGSKRFMLEGESNADLDAQKAAEKKAKKAKKAAAKKKSGG
eukprot:CAMPEP_0117428826 /NCGR_PEP_ID=MMETSP0758-20121206/8448_1 /TAXON_ID=63605 /ORGANISM="Percolomonas cosmopolitus, Strain AE-1 (ATCC 50343)" /LENGTH=375 /DNA_ID=CAMNT_0005215399 /DNA_START=124 /DNA_END=1247 /DNA_ORIENTATION=+